MELRFLIDTNTVIDYLGNKLTSKSSLFLDNLTPAISVITRIEILGWFQINSNQLTELLSFINASFIYSLDEKVIMKTIELRQEFKMKTPDAIIAATALIYNQTLISRNTEDFDKILNLSIINPYEI